MRLRLSQSGIISSRSKGRDEISPLKSRYMRDIIEFATANMSRELKSVHVEMASLRKRVIPFARS